MTTRPRRRRWPTRNYGSPLTAVMTGLTRFLAAFVLIAGAQAIVTPPSVPAQARSWEAVVETSGPGQDEFIAELLTTLPLTDALTVARTLPRREDPDIGVPLRALHAGPGAGTRRAELLTRVALDALRALPEGRRRPALEANARLLQQFLTGSARLESAMLRGALWRSAALLSEETRRTLLPAARSAAAALNARFVAAADERAGDVSPERTHDPELAAEGLAFVAYAAVTPDATLFAIVDAIREGSRDPALVERARFVLEIRSSSPSR